jgi:hypothetical protein
VWVYRRWFEAIAPRSDELSAFCATHPVLAIVAVTPDAQADVARRLGAILGKRREAIATLAGWPWSHHALKLDVTSAPGVVRVRIVACRVLRSREVDPPAVTDVLLALESSEPKRIRDCWLSPFAYTDVTGALSAPQGWRLVPKRGRRRPLEPFQTAPAWVQA